MRVFKIKENLNGWEVLYDGLHRLLARYLRYFTHTWIGSAIGLERLNLWSTDTKTNNAIEAYNGKLNKNRKPHTNVYQLLDILSLEICITYWTWMSDTLDKKLRPQRLTECTKEEWISAVKEAYRRRFSRR